MNKYLRMELNGIQIQNLFMYLHQKMFKFGIFVKLNAFIKLLLKILNALLIIYNT